MLKHSEQKTKLVCGCNFLKMVVKNKMLRAFDQSEMFSARTTPKVPVLLESTNPRSCDLLRSEVMSLVIYILVDAANSSKGSDSQGTVPAVESGLMLLM